MRFYEIYYLNIYSFDYNLNDKIIFMHKLSYLPSLEESFSDYFMHTDAEIRFLLAKSMFSSFKVILDYDSTPAGGIGSTDSKYIFSLG
ncbi:MAG TPA: hypothetical protein DD405_04785 [Desulfobacteraceae bacterium]|nr:hypothetical protein [Desulfobacteraceae bacterium]